MFLLFLATACAAPVSEPVMEENKDRQLTKCEVKLGGHVQTLKKGEPWGKFEDGRFLDVSAVEGPSLFTTHFPSGRSYTTYSSTVFLYSSSMTSRAKVKDLVCQVCLVPVHERQPFPQALAAVERICKELKVEDEPQVKEFFKKWKDEKPDERFSNSVCTGGKVEDDVNARFEVKYDTTRKGWFVIMEFAMPKLVGLPAPK